MVSASRRQLPAQQSEGKPGEHCGGNRIECALMLPKSEMLKVGGKRINPTSDQKLFHQK
jgi:hypothetical protein